MAYRWRIMDTFIFGNRRLPSTPDKRGNIRLGNSAAKGGRQQSLQSLQYRISWLIGMGNPWSKYELCKSITALTDLAWGSDPCITCLWKRAFFRGFIDFISFASDNLSNFFDRENYPGNSSNALTKTVLHTADR